MNLKHITIFFIISYVHCSAQSLAKKADSIRLKYEIPEMAFAIITPDIVVQQEYLGYHKLGDHTAKDTARSSDYFHLGSNTKAITGFIAAYIVEHNQIKWATKIFDIFPEWKNQSNSAYYQVTLQDLLSHKGRIEPYTSEIERNELPEFKGNKANQRQQFAAYLLREKPVAVNSLVGYNYSNAGYTIAAAMLEKVTGKTWEQLVNDIINKKLQFKAAFGWP
ncbi:MAG TPA: serine hydrolase, partial [Mucilaginibacter sp.]